MRFRHVYVKAGGAEYNEVLEFMYGISRLKLDVELIEFAENHQGREEVKFDRVDIEDIDIESVFEIWKMVIDNRTVDREKQVCIRNYCFPYLFNSHFWSFTDNSVDDFLIELSIPSAWPHTEFLKLDTILIEELEVNETESFSFTNEIEYIGSDLFVIPAVELQETPIVLPITFKRFKVNSLELPSMPYIKTVKTRGIYDTSFYIQSTYHLEITKDFRMKPSVPSYKATPFIQPAKLPNPVKKPDALSALKHLTYLPSLPQKPVPATKKVRFASQDYSFNYSPCKDSSPLQGVPYKIMLSKSSDYALEISKYLSIPSPMYLVTLEIDSDCIFPIDIILNSSTSVLFCDISVISSQIQTRHLIDELSQLHHYYEIVFILIIGTPSASLEGLPSLMEFVTLNVSVNKQYTPEFCSSLLEAKEFLELYIEKYISSIPDLSPFSGTQKLLNEELTSLSKFFLQCPHFNPYTAKLTESICLRNSISLLEILKLSPKTQQQLLSLSIPSKFISSMTSLITSPFPAN